MIKSKYISITIALTQIVGWTAMVLEVKAFIHDLQWYMSFGAMDFEFEWAHNCGQLLDSKNTGSEGYGSRFVTDEVIFIVILLTFLGATIANIISFFHKKNRSNCKWKHSMITKLIYIFSGFALLYASYLLWQSAYQIDKQYETTAAFLLKDLNYDGGNCFTKRKEALSDIYLICYNKSIFYHETIPFFLAVQGYQSYSDDKQPTEQHWVEQFQNFMLSNSNKDKDPSVLIIHGEEYRFSQLNQVGFCQQEKHKLVASILTTVCALLCWLVLWRPCCCQTFENEDDEIVDDTDDVEYVYPTLSCKEMQNQFSLMEKASFYCGNGHGNFVELYCPQYPTVYNQFTANHSSWSNLHTYVCSMNARSLKDLPIVRVKKGVEKSFVVKDRLGLY